MAKSGHIRFFVLAIIIYVIIQMLASGLLKLPYNIMRQRHVYRPPTTDAREHEQGKQVVVETANGPERVPGPNTQSYTVKILRGSFRKNEGYLTIGLCSVPRTGASYLIDTLESLFSRLTDPQKQEVVVVLFLGSQDANWINGTLADLDQHFDKEIQSSLLQVIQPLPHIYPNFSSVMKQNFGDNLERVRWRTKQNIDFAHLFFHSSNISQYYIQIEDDVIVASDFLNDIKRFLKKQETKRTKWFVIEFSALGFIGKMFHSKHLPVIKQYLLMFKEEQPCDLLINHMKRVMVQPKDIRSYLSLFQHIGRVSSLNNKTQTLTDKRFKDGASPIFVIKESFNPQVPSFKRNKNRYTKHFSSPNPEAKITTTMEVYKDYLPQNAYMKYSSFFWGKDPRFGDYIEIKLKSLTTITGIVIKTGYPRLGTDKLMNGELRLARELDENNDCKVKDEYNVSFSGSFDVIFRKPRPIICAVIVIKEDQKSWLIVNEIELRTP